MTSVVSAANISISTVIRISNYINYGIPSLPEVLCIDEFKGNAETGKYQCILVDGKKNKVLDIIPDRSQNHLVSYFKQFPPKKRLNVKLFFNIDCFQKIKTQDNMDGIISTNYEEFRHKHSDIMLAKIFRYQN